MKHDVAVAWNWEHDAEFVADLERRCRERGLTFRSVTPQDVDRFVEAAAAGDVAWGVLLDRAWESDKRFRRLNDLVAAKGTRVLNPPELSLKMGNKAAMHALLSGKGVPVPKCVDFMPAEYCSPVLAGMAEGWRRPLWLKPANAGGGDGVVALEQLPDNFPQGPEWLPERFVLQEHAAPIQLDGKPAWFRVFHVFGTIHVFWWHPATHVFAPVTASEEAAHSLTCVRETVAAVASIAGLEIFSSEIALSAPHSPLVVDPVNDPVDFRRRSKATDAIPDDRLAEMIVALANGIAGIVHTAKPPASVEGAV